MQYEIALIGNPNTGKSTVFNALTGLKQHIGNWPGVTVEKKEGEFKYGGFKYKVVDLPGVYGLTARSVDEQVARDYIINEKPNVVVDIVDASNIERNLYLTFQLLEIGANVVIALNKMDLAKEMGYNIDVKRLEELLGVPVVPMIASKEQGIEELKKTIDKSIGKKPSEVIYSNFEPYILRLINILSKDNGLKDKYNLKYLAIKSLENDDYVIEIIKNSSVYSEFKEELSDILNELNKKYEDVNSAIADERYRIISNIVNDATTKKAGALTTTKMLDEVFTHKYLGIPILITFLWMAFQFTFNVSAPYSDMIDTFFGWLGDFVSSYFTGWVASLLGDGIIAGLGSVLVFLPPIICMFLAFSFLEDSGYMARAAFVMDKVMNKFGLHGKSVIPLVMGFGCNVPAIMATRTLEDEKDRILTILVNPLMSCSARLPVYVIIAGAFFAANAGSVVTSMYVLGVVLALIMAYLFRKLIFKGKPSHFIMELPPYNKPNWKNILGNTWERSSKFLTKAGTIIFGGVVLVWLLSVFGPAGYLGAGALDNEALLAKSWVALLGHSLAPIFSPMGWDWKAVVALFFGFIAKEVVVGTFGMLYGVGEDDVALQSAIAHSGAFDPVTAYAFMAFVLIYIPCVATIGVIKQEIGWKWALFTVGYGLILAYIVALGITVIGHLIFYFK
ncbi:ferrous iron transport protein B [Methanothermococcus okinawensis]|uniref:Ferrous iron transport protein B n=1 Tax=Methanothermococcus okinawensis (strain DSM 14208 / JCM 11175 / IH1) TaxID=647113 RepID=F8AK90_METOI|nr:ferrous iron transport protein B [Methanothermococcus okinawensis]AEH07463.1 ferrous iron transport protein B [Methanothermococcus okinawensis IH1]